MSFYCIETGYTSIFRGIQDHPISRDVKIVAGRIRVLEVTPDIISLDQVFKALKS